MPRQSLHPFWPRHTYKVILSRFRATVVEYILNINDVLTWRMRVRNGRVRAGLLHVVAPEDAAARQQGLGCCERGETSTQLQRVFLTCSRLKTIAKALDASVACVFQCLRRCFLWCIPHPIHPTCSRGTDSELAGIETQLRDS